ncbi:phosphoadenylyl-sulfate reductase [Polynucleobacter sphagniphilus]|jgi:phosphoadenosine phosphosulfate reductase|uniref:Adenosine 5'-phosphosulfate reductase n=1 Tax=Polynucleobacter sphagniphilus TaxID=1743169 RepID=A0AA43M9J5_9BURK|nr:phosphoadenylyl-sulfate reductase [Polynucleobacter sphagniphilus]MDF9787399.1 phosphoadenosine phosphosulfate reductase [Polynucleobacter sphagniphilus]MDH6154231.1 phosphoadenosine phosphosulfate reductase [Polynucleobacter sphagniphilus]MDH6248199.1 phosphoadenosine phosphosulfate reductase [Polynucleobacter sphagniphilus]MDH6299878.1 phosphoadenosine phosphosulfate reductase [Polynucleobacter sphagniphilus]MDH6302197.1 phosphoadenosine phosphosulfate reductase [Polynucleobacter sphagnip
MMTPQLWSIPVSTLTPEQLAEKSATLYKRLQDIGARFSKVRFATSLAAEDMVITDAISKTKTSIALFTLATGRLHQETVDMVKTTEDQYGLRIDKIYPHEVDIDAFVDQYGMNGFYDGEEAKKACCGARKIKPLNAALIGADAWLTGQRREQSTTRTELHFEEMDEARGIAKFNPLFDWTEADIWAYIKQESVPIHPLHLKGYPSIGCEPCTRQVKQGEDIRAGRWWWLQSDSKECGLHINR